MSRLVGDTQGRTRVNKSREERGATLGKSKVGEANVSLNKQREKNLRQTNSHSCDIQRGRKKKKRGRKLHASAADHHEIKLVYRRERLVYTMPCLLINTNAQLPARNYSVSY